MRPPTAPTTRRRPRRRQCIAHGEPGAEDLDADTDGDAGAAVDIDQAAAAAAGGEQQNAPTGSSLAGPDRREDRTPAAAAIAVQAPH